MRKQRLLELAAEIERDLRAVRQILGRPLEAEIARGNLTGPQQSTMSVLVAAGGMSLKDLSKQLGLAHSTVSGIVDRLANQGLVERQTDRSDGRITKIVATRVVREFVAKTMPSLEMHPLAGALSAATLSEREQVREGVRILRRLLERENGKPPARKAE